MAMLAGMQLDLFTPLTEGPMTVTALASALGVGAEKLMLLLDNLVSAGLLADVDGHFANTPEADHFLVRGKPHYMGGMQDFIAIGWRDQLQTAASIRTGHAQAVLNWEHMTEDDLAAIMRPLHNPALALGTVLAARYDFSAYHSVLDVGGGSGGISIRLAHTCPTLRATIVELPSVTPITRQFVAEAGMTDRIDVVTANGVAEPLTGSYDAAVLSKFIHVLPREAARQALRHVCDALRPGGTLYILGAILDDSRRTPDAAVASNMAFLNWFDGGQAYTEGEHRQWLRDAGFAAVRRDEAMAPANAETLVAQKAV